MFPEEVGGWAMTIERISFEGGPQERERDF